MRKKRKADSSETRTAAIYARFSSYNQREESIEQQVAECKAYADYNKYTIVDIYADSAKTGRTDRRPQFMRLRREAEKGRFAYIIAYKSNRIARNIFNALKFESEMDELGIEVLYAKEEFGNNAAGRFALRSMMNVNQFFSENMAEDIKRNQADNAQSCKANGPASFGYKSGENGKFVIDEEPAAIVKEIFTRVGNGEPFVDIASDFNKRGLKTRKGNEWGRSSFANILHNERYMGIYIFDNVRIEGGMPEIISKELFYKVQDVLKNKKNPQGRHRENGDYLLTGKIFCGECKSPMVGVSGTGRSGNSYYYYVCNEKHLGGKCRKKPIRRDLIEATVAQKIQEYILQPEIIQWIADRTIEIQRQLDIASEISSLENQLDDVTKSIKNIISYIEKGEDLSDVMKERMRDLEDERKELVGSIATTKAYFKPVTKEQVISWLKSFEGGNCEKSEYKKKLFNSFLKAVYVYDNGKLEITFSTLDINNNNHNTSAEIDLPTDLDGAKNSITSCTGHQLLGSPNGFIKPFGGFHFYGIFGFVRYLSAMNIF